MNRITQLITTLFIFVGSTMSAENIKLQMGDWEVRESISVNNGRTITNACTLELDTWKYKIYFTRISFQGSITVLKLSRSALALGTYWPWGKWIHTKAEYIEINDRRFFATVGADYEKVIQIVNSSDDTDSSSPSTETAIRFFRHLSKSNKITMKANGKAFLKVDHSGLDRALPYLFSCLNRIVY